MATVNTEKFISFVTEKWGGRACPMCGKGPWSVQESIFQLSEFHDGHMVIGGPLIPVVPVTCGNCGHTVIVNAILSGAISPPPPLPSTSNALEKEE